MEATGNVLLFVDDNSALHRGARTLLKSKFSHILTAGSDAEADVLLLTNPVTHLMVDYFLGDANTGDHCIRKWRALYPSIRQAILISGSVSEINQTDIDAVYTKPFDFNSITFKP
jgi:CheY-like chemotaxis protein